MLTKKILEDLPKCYGWQIAGVLYYDAHLTQISEYRFKVNLPKDITFFNSYTENDLWEILFNQSNVLSWKKFKKKSENLNEFEINHLKDAYLRSFISSSVTDFNKRSENGQFVGQIKNYPTPRIARSLPQISSSGKIINISKHIENLQEAEIVSSFWEKSFKRAAKNVARSKTCVAHTLPASHRNRLLIAGEEFINDINNNSLLDIESRFPMHEFLLELKKAY